MERARNIPIDIAKGISIILVVFGHNHIRHYFPELQQALSLIRMPLFFFVSGVFFKYSERFDSFLFRKTDALLKPYIVTLLVVGLLFNVGDWSIYLIKVMFGTSFSIIAPFKPLWFLPHLWLLFVVSYALTRITKLDLRSIPIKLSVIAVLLICGLMYFEYVGHYRFGIFENKELSKGLPLSADILLTSLPFFLSGSLFGDSIKNFKPKLAFILLSIAVFSFSLYYFEPMLGMTGRRINDPIIFIPSVISGIYMVMTLSFYCSRSSILTRFFLFYGTASLFILLFHSAFRGIANFLINNTLGRSEYSYLLVFFLSASIPVLLKRIVENIKPIKWLLLPIIRKNK